MHIEYICFFFFFGSFHRPYLVDLWHMENWCVVVTFYNCIITKIVYLANIVMNSINGWMWCALEPRIGYRRQLDYCFYLLLFRGCSSNSFHFVVYYVFFFEIHIIVFRRHRKCEKQSFWWPLIALFACNMWTNLYAISHLATFTRACKRTQCTASHCRAVFTRSPGGGHTMRMAPRTQNLLADQFVNHTICAIGPVLLLVHPKQCYAIDYLNNEILVYSRLGIIWKN